MNQTIHSCTIISIPKIQDYRGNLGVIEKNILPFKVKRVYYLYDVPSGSVRGGHAHKKLHQFLIALSGSFDVILKDGVKEKAVTLNNPSEGLLITHGIWRELENFSSGSICLVLASEVFDEDDYIRSFVEFKDSKTTK
ncbi:FdtA/QdtA family cupin domain-containing protein [Tamlana sp. 2201CG12-4]|uniref:sugar 3,4-ketoisomerase n=1 Tax=Tamlana sp. 2201CG12-4 TaxID=3112582 RepID=UPI002DB73CF4|nr:FdtA/QdtA family cupin domain-containing protein [Tamlana sp. 2201CG12-4]MEC3907247.1 FdtA/QdtA family cupin domain-containing protein [Tamlana sp. 2201CG12-4]